MLLSMWLRTNTIVIGMSIESLRYWNCFLLEIEWLFFCSLSYPLFVFLYSFAGFGVAAVAAIACLWAYSGDFEGAVKCCPSISCANLKLCFVLCFELWLPECNPFARAPRLWNDCCNIDLLYIQSNAKILIFYLIVSNYFYFLFFVRACVVVRWRGNASGRFFVVMHVVNKIYQAKAPYRKFAWLLYVCKDWFVMTMVLVYINRYKLLLRCKLVCLLALEGVFMIKILFFKKMM